MRTSTNQRIAAVALGAIAVTTTGVAYAYWTTSGSGTGEGSTTAGVTDQLSFTQQALTAMHPGDAPQPLSVTVENVSTTEAVHVATVKAFVTTNTNDCTGADFRLGGTAAPSTATSARPLTWTAADLASGGQADATSTIQFNNTGADQDACKGAVVTVHYVAG